MSSWIAELFNRSVELNSAVRPWQQSDWLGFDSCDKISPLHYALRAGEFISSPNNKYFLVMEASGDLALYNSWLWVSANRLWSSGSMGKGSGAPYTLTLPTTPSNARTMAINDRNGDRVWDCGVKHQGRLCLKLMDNGRVTLVDEHSPRVLFSIDSALKIETRDDSFEDVVLPLISDTVATTLEMQREALVCVKDDDVVDVFIKKGPRIAQLLTAATSATSKMLERTNHRVSAALLKQKELVEALEARNTDHIESTLALEAIRKQVDEQEQAVREAEERLTELERAVDNMQREMNRIQQEYKQYETNTFGKVFLAMLSNPFDFTSKLLHDKSRLDAALRLRGPFSEECAQRRSYYDELIAQLEKIRGAERLNLGKKKLATIHLLGLQAEMDELKEARSQLAELHVSLATKCNRLGIAAGSAQILQHETEGFITMSPLITLLKEVVERITETGLVSSDTSAALLADLKMVDAAAQRIKGLEIEPSKAIEDMVVSNLWA
ncbi:hypothetical protein AMAG_03097 [Allomyces macrogynus ATCC 38327]|uniref:Bulb-type lectin domain-containing protein n=1 Tax=Allomyces macrogynus (strain ATCC 38327) TaxID=578462 RepID=A0A0L0S4K0_ALLM3|nr:hypothetical protein AMAG_03097 [Allomyces macrogynus ATCC 38327]|eukprot:KNE57375.1 hypothetical protein AMAG_03097 [Allomyces macrogynus ATCC 38327]